MKPLLVSAYPFLSHPVSTSYEAMECRCRYLDLTPPVNLFCTSGHWWTYFPDVTQEALPLGLDIEC
jgi:hypothetical protein